MNQPVSTTRLEQLSEFVARQMGLRFSREHWADLEKGVRSATREFGFDSTDACVEWLLAAPLSKHQIEVLASNLTVGETYFFREKSAFEILEMEILPRLIRRKRGSDQRLRIWSAGCCTGEEPYSIAILLKRLLFDREKWDIHLLATDINPRFLRTAADGVFGQWSFRGVPAGIRECYFTPAANGRFAIRDELRQMVEFQYLNLADDSFPALLNNTAGMDLILCRNVLIYMGERQIAMLADRLARALADGGWLIVGASETAHVPHAGLSVVRFPGMTAYQRPEHGLLQIHSANPVQDPGIGGPLASQYGDKAVRTADPGRAARREARPVVPLPPHAKGSDARSDAKPQPAAAEDPLSSATALYDRGLYAEAEQRLASLAAGDSPPGPVLVLLARACANRGDLARASHWVGQALACDRMNPRLHYLNGMIHQEQGNTTEAMACFRRAIYLEPDFVMAHLALGHLAERMDRPGDAGRNFDTAAALLRDAPPEAAVPESEGMSAGRLAEMILHLREMTPSKRA